MRTTISIDERLLAEARGRAHERRQTLGQLIEDAIRRELGAAGATDRPPIPVVHGRGGPQPGLDLSSNRALLETVDEGRSEEHWR